MQIDILTIFPKLIDCYAGESVLGKARKNGILKIQAHNFRDFTKDKHKRVDDKPYGGGPGMILQIQPIYDCLKSLNLLDKKENKINKTKIIIMDPAEKKFDQKKAKSFSQLNRLVLISGRYEGFDERIYKLADEKISVGDYILAGGELPALTVVEAVARLVPGVLGNPDSLEEESMQKDMQIEYPQYTRPEDFMGQKVPKILLSGDHKKIAEWRKKKSKNYPQT